MKLWERDGETSLPEEWWDLEEEGIFGEWEGEEFLEWVALIFSMPPIGMRSSDSLSALGVAIIDIKYGSSLPQNECAQQTPGS